MSDEHSGIVEDNVEDVTTRELTRANLTKAVIETLAKKASGKAIKGIDDKAGYEEVRKIRLECREMRVLAEKICKKGREEAVLIQKKWIGVEKDVTGQISAIEDPLKKMEEEHLKAKEDAANEIIRLEEVRVNDLILQLKAYGWDGNPLPIGRMTNDEFTAYLSEVREKWESIEAHRIAEEKRKLDEAKALEAQKEAQRIEAERLETERRKMQEEREAFEAEKNAARIAEGKRVQAIKDAEEKAKQKKEQAEIKAQKEAQAVEEARLTEERQKIKAEQLRLQRVEEERKAEEAKKEAQRIAEEQRLAEEARRKDEAPDLEKVKEWVNEIRNAVSNAPAMKTQAGTDHVLAYKTSLLNALKSI